MKLQTTKTPSTPAKSKRDKPYLIHAPAQLRALASPARQEIVDALVAAGPCSMAELAAHLGRPPDSLYFHMRTLLKVGLALELDPRKQGRHVAAMYDVPGRPVFLRYAGTPEPAVQTVIASALRLGARDFRNGFKSSYAVLDGPDRTVWGGRVKGWVTPAEVREINTLIAKLFQLVRRGRPGKGRHPQTFTFAYAPVQLNPRAAKSAGPRSPKPQTKPQTKSQATPLTKGDRR